jgi:hypothetical protein
VGDRLGGMYGGRFGGGGGTGYHRPGTHYWYGGKTCDKCGLTKVGNGFQRVEEGVIVVYGKASAAKCEVPTQKGQDGGA